MSTGCEGCQRGETFDLPFSIAFQPIVDVRTRRTFGHEALVRGPKGEGAWSVLSKVTDENRYYFDQQCRVKAIGLAASLYPADENLKLSINFMPNAVYEPRACIRQTLATADRLNFPLRNIIFEFTENEKMDTDHVLRVLETYREIGFGTAIDDFGAGHAGLGLLAKFQPDIVKLDMDLIRNIDTDTSKQIIVRHTLRMLEELGVTPLCEGVETAAELAILQELGVGLMQGYLLARPAFETIVTPQFDA
jgi:EAL domain-containing protein (putative c-di-GMP-specific phosphodiesterase class I)